MNQCSQWGGAPVFTPPTPAVTPSALVHLTNGGIHLPQRTLQLNSHLPPTGSGATSLVSLPREGGRDGQRRPASRWRAAAGGGGRLAGLTRCLGVGWGGQYPQIRFSLLAAPGFLVTPRRLLPFFFRQAPILPRGARLQHPSRRALTAGSPRAGWTMQVLGCFQTVLLLLLLTGE